MSRIRIAAIALAVMVALSMAAPGAGAQVIEKKLILQEGATNTSPALAPGIMVGNTLYLSGVLPPRAVRDSSMSVQTKGTINQALAVLKAAKMDLSDVVSVTVYLADMADFAEMNKGYAELFTTDPRPTRTTVAVAGLFGGAKIEITMTAVKTK